MTLINKSISSVSDRSPLRGVKPAFAEG